MQGQGVSFPRSHQRVPLQHSTSIPLSQGIGLSYRLWRRSTLPGRSFLWLTVECLGSDAYSASQSIGVRPDWVDSRSCGASAAVCTTYKSAFHVPGLARRLQIIRSG
ncbi:hypothetical protein CB0940_09158 [Cercospora beticola]|uniref:Uncharacterized protein n=1 Tax=Cercospora beticola TaxID=122368 RepID=A0A2G5HH24_CERBT|nr:hypothetical protein CB0940_09158 [Cercospora beticola]PIA91841.1 hypothetical protein CB0940_09158 [Cercospora beticola]